jgi:crotonobetainyl-CoA:carnitine CoA-transferase CaiB-like acyl-CoA transferase
VGAAGSALASLVATGTGGATPGVTVDRELASAWFQLSIRPIDWSVPLPWDAVAGDYPGADGWIRLHTNAPHHRTAALDVLGVPGDRDAVARAVATWGVEELESAVVAAGGSAAAMRSRTAWERHPQGLAVAAEPLLRVERTTEVPAVPPSLTDPGRPLAGLRILDLTRVLAGPVATRLLAGWGADVLRIDPLDWDEPSIAPEVTLGKRCARLDLRAPAGRSQLLDLLGTADVLVHGYRSDALEGLGLGAAVRQDRRPGLVDVSLDAYGWTGPWATRGGFDSLVQMSAGIAEAGQQASGADRPVPLPVQALDHATGYLMAAAALWGLTLRVTEGRGSRWRTSLARMASLLMDAGTVAGGLDAEWAPPEAPDDGPPEQTVWGDARRLAPPVMVAGAPLQWTLPARPLGSDPARWAE